LGKRHARNRLEVSRNWLFAGMLGYRDEFFDVPSLGGGRNYCLGESQKGGFGRGNPVIFAASNNHTDKASTGV
jgi:hypothetical protein